jgi:hypothetical protein
MVGVTIRVDCHGIVLPVVVVESLVNSVEHPLLCISVLDISSEIKPVVSMCFYDSLHWHSRDNVEWSIDVPSEVAVKSLVLNLISFIKIDNLPSLVDVSVSVVNNDLLSFLILAS